jgi:hypothetical protein
MNPAPNAAPPVINPAPVPERTLRRLFLTLFLRGRSSRRLQLDKAPKSLARKLTFTLVAYALFGLFSLFFIRQPIFGLAIYLHSMIFVFLGMFVASSAGEILFNKEEADILLHRPVTARDLLWSKIRVLMQVSLWLAGAFNLVGTFVGLAASDGNALFPLIHIVSTVLQALFCTSCVVMVYQLCLRWFGRERLEGLMTTAQVLVAVAAVFAGQILPRLLITVEGVIRFSPATWWIGLMPPAWFASMDDAVAGTGHLSSILLGGFGVLVTACVVWLAFGKLAGDYETGLQALGESVSRRRPQGRKRWINALVNSPPLRWFLPNSVSRASFLLTTAYLLRDRDVKLRVYPGIAPMMVMPMVFLFQSYQQHGGLPAGFAFAYAGAFLASLPLLTLEFLQYSQQWQASDIFRAAPMLGPADLCRGARQAVISLLILPSVLVVATIMWLALKDASNLLLLLPGLIATPVTALVPAALNRGIPLSLPTEEAKSANRSMIMVGVMFVSMALSGIALAAWSFGFFKWMILAELIVMIPVYIALRVLVAKLRWQSIE